MRRYSNNAAQTTLSSAATSAATTITVSAVTGLPAPDFVLALDYGTGNQELVLVTGVAGTTLTVERGYDNTTAVAHDTGAVVVHTHSAADFADSRNHEAATTNVHGVTGAVVGTTDTQVVSNKDLTAATNTFPASLTTDAELSAHASATTGVHGVGTGAVVGTTEAQALTNKDLTDATNTFPSTVVSTTGTQTLTNKTINLDTTTYAGGAWQSFLIQASWNLGDANLLSNYYRQEGKTVYFQITMALGNSAGPSGNLTLGLPVAAADATGIPVGRASIKDASASTRPFYAGTVVLNTSTQVIILLNDTNIVSANYPMPWATGDVLYVSGCYRAA